MSYVKWRSADEPVSTKDVYEAAKEIGVKFPQDYVKCVLENNGAHVSPEIFDVAGKEKVFGTLLTYDKEDDEYIVEVYHDYQDTLPKHVIPFAFDPAGNLICFDYKDHEENPIVVFWEHEGTWEKEVLIESEGITIEEVEEVARGNVFYIASTFTAFLNKLHD
ncbi:1,3-beta-glucan synthase regulator [Bacillus pseudomycoides]|nr:1,3-beta-glucan synthase regulator [Bacillus pseudomycoides]